MYNHLAGFAIRATTSVQQNGSSGAADTAADGGLTLGQGALVMEQAGSSVVQVQVQQEQQGQQQYGQQRYAVVHLPAALQVVQQHWDGLLWRRVEGILGEMQ
jgi:hypothetical protein